MSRRHASARQLEREAEELAGWGDGPVAAAIIMATPARCRECDRPFVPGDQTGGTWVHDCTHVATAAAGASAPSAVDAALATLVRAATSAKKRLTPAQAKAVREQMADSGSSRAEAEAWVLGMGGGR